ncbi:MAG: Bpu10I family restriction endonuclease [Planctomycetaceae bacterium]|jgi:hypothetical protein|nr:Bpu10I family restriction endonuclease [Planctomycetaceae bacterium]
MIFILIFDIVGNIEKSVNCWNDYLDFVRKKNKAADGTLIFSSQSKFEPTILEEVLYRMFKEYESDKIKIGGIKAFSNMFFSPSDFVNFQEHSNIKINTTDQDFAIYKQVDILITDNNTPANAFVPVLAVECKTYLDKIMLEDSVATAEKIKNGNPYCRFCIVVERYDVDRKVDIKNSRIDQIYILKKDAKKSNADSIRIAKDVVKLIYEDTKKHLNATWVDIEKSIREKGIVFE